MRRLRHVCAVVSCVVLLGTLTGCSPEERGAVGITLDSVGRLTVVAWDCDPDAPVGLSLLQVPEGERYQDADWQEVAVLDAARGDGNLVQITLADPPAGWTGQRGPAGIDRLPPEAEYQVIVRVGKESFLNPYGYNAGVMSFTGVMLARLRTDGGQVPILGQSSVDELEDPQPRLLSKRGFRALGERACRPHSR